MPSILSRIGRCRRAAAGLGRSLVLGSGLGLTGPLVSGLWPLVSLSLVDQAFELRVFLADDGLRDTTDKDDAVEEAMFKEDQADSDEYSDSGDEVLSDGDHESESEKEEESEDDDSFEGEEDDKDQYAKYIYNGAT